MKNFLIIALVFISLQSISQSYDSLFFALRQKKINFTDELGKKQGEWTYYKIPLCQNDSSVLTQEPNHIFISETSKGEYLNNQKVGIWEYYDDDYNPCYKGCQQITRDIIKEVYYSQDSIKIFGYSYGHISYEIVLNYDTSYFISRVYDYNDMVIGTCCKEKYSDTTICKLFGGINKDFIRKEYRFIDVEEAIELIECGWLCW